MKEFKDNLDEESINKGSVDRFSSSTPSRTFVQKAVQVLSRYSLLIIVGLAAVSITVLHFQGRYLLQALRGTPLPTFWLERITKAPPVPDKTEVYQQALAEEAKEAWRKRSQKITKPQWQASYRTPVTATEQDSVVADTIRREPPAKKRRVRRRRKKLAVASSPTKNDSVVTEKPSFFQPVRVASSPTGSNSTFLSCVVHGDQEVDNRQRMVLRLTENASVRGKEVSAGTLIYGLARMSQNRVQVVISRVGTQVVNYRVYDHTYHEGITLDERDDVVGEAAKETAWRQGNQLGRRGNQELPTRIASDLARGLLQRTRRNGRIRAVFLPDGYPVYIAAL
jgi:hypothetical protein